MNRGLSEGQDGSTTVSQLTWYLVPVVDPFCCCPSDYRLHLIKNMDNRGYVVYRVAVSPLGDVVLLGVLLCGAASLGWKVLIVANDVPSTPYDSTDGLLPAREHVSSKRRLAMASQRYIMHRHDLDTVP